MKGWRLEAGCSKILCCAWDNAGHFFKVQGSSTRQCGERPLWPDLNSEEPAEQGSIRKPAAYEAEEMRGTQGARGHTSWRNPMVAEMENEQGTLNCG